MTAGRFSLVSDRGLVIRAAPNIPVKVPSHDSYLSKFLFAHPDYVAHIIAPDGTLLQSIRAAPHDPPVEVSGLNLADVYPKDDWSHIRTTLKSVIETRRPCTISAPARFAGILGGDVHLLPYQDGLILSLTRRVRKKPTRGNHGNKTY